MRNFFASFISFTPTRTYKISILNNLQYWPNCLRLRQYSSTVFIIGPLTAKVGSWFPLQFYWSHSEWKPATSKSKQSFVKRFSILFYFKLKTNKFYIQKCFLYSFFFFTNYCINWISIFRRCLTKIKPIFVLLFQSVYNNIKINKLFFPLLLGSSYTPFLVFFTN